MSDNEAPPPQPEEQNGPGPPEAHRRRGIALYRRRRFAEAADEFRLWAGASETAPADLALGRALLSAGDRENAETVLRRAVRRDPQLVRGHLLLARIALAANKLDQAQAHLKRAIGSHASSATLNAMLARVLMRRARQRAARKAALAALALDPGCTAAALIIAELQFIEGDVAQAREALHRLAEQRPDWPELRALLARLPPTPTRADEEETGDPPTAAEFAFAIPSSAGRPATAADGVPALLRPDLLDHVFMVQALILRHLRLHYRGTRMGFLLEYVRPSVVMLFHYFLFVALKKPMPARIPVELFIMGSFPIWFAAVHVLRATGNTGRDGRGVPGVTGLHLAVARAVWEFFSMVSFTIVSVLLLELMGLNEPLPNVVATATYFMLAVAMGFGLGLILLASGRVFAATEALKKNLYWILYVTSGHYFSIAQGRHGLAGLVWWNPILHLTELQRRALYPGYPTELVTYWYPVVIAAGLIITGLLLEKCTQNRIQERSA